MNVPEQRATRFRFLRKLYEEVGGRTSSTLNMFELGESLGLERSETADVVEYLANERLLERRAFGGAIGLSHAGVKEVEQALQNPNVPTVHFPAVFNITNVGTMIDSQIQQGSHGSTQHKERADFNVDQLKEFTTLLREQLPQLHVSEADRSEAEGDLATIEAQVASSRPKLPIIKESLHSLRVIIEGAGGGLLASALLPKLLHLLAALGAQ